MRWSGNLEEEEKREGTTHAPRPFTAQAHHMNKRAYSMGRHVRCA